MPAGQITQAYPGPDPEGGAEGVESQETRPPHAGGARDDPVGLAEPFDEACDGDDPGAVRVKEHLGLGQPLLGEAHVAAPAQDQRAAAVMPDGEADVVADYGRHEADDADHDDVEPARARVG